jgi:hypothetical protein
MIFALISAIIFSCSAVETVLLLLSDDPLTFSVLDSGAELSVGLSPLTCVILLTPVHEP